MSRNDGDQYSVLAGRAIDQHVAIIHASGQIEYGLPDAINSTAMTVDQTGSKKSSFLYEPFGQTTTTSTYPFQFTGRVPVSSSTYYYRARFYNTATGRFISEDPVGFGGVNLYPYARNNPVNLTDPSGTQAAAVSATVPIIVCFGTGVCESLLTYAVVGAAVLGTGYLIYEGVQRGVEICYVGAEQKHLDYIARKYGVDRNALREAIHREKKYRPKGNNLTEEEIDELARELARK